MLTVLKNSVSFGKQAQHIGFGGKFCDMTMVESFSSLVFWLPEPQDCRLANSTNGGYITF
jgi:hypothetical protein